MKAHAPKDGGKHVHTTFGCAFKGGKGRNALDPMNEEMPEFKAVEHLGVCVKKIWCELPEKSAWQVGFRELMGGAKVPPHNEPMGVHGLVGFSWGYG